MTMNMYAADIAFVEKYLSGVNSTAELPEQCRRFLAKILVLGSAYGSGDALAGLILKDVTLEMIQKIARLVKIEPVPKAGGRSGAMQLLSGRTGDEMIDKLLHVLEQASTSGRSPDFSELHLPQPHASVETVTGASEEMNHGSAS